MPMPTSEQIARMKKNSESLKKLNDLQMIMLALSEIISIADEIPVGKRIPLQSELEIRAGVKQVLDEV